MSLTDVLSFILAFFIFYFTIKFLSKLRQKDVFKDRLQELVQHKERLSQEVSTPTQKLYRRLREEKPSFFQNIINKVQKRSVEEQERLFVLFEKAGLKSDHAYMYYQSAKILMTSIPTLFMGSLIFFFTEWNILYKIIATLGIAFLGSYSVDFILRFLVDARQERIRKAFPAAIDLMVICAEAGLSLIATIQRVAREISQISPDLGYELALLSIELSMLPDRHKALQHFSDRLDTPYFKAVVSNIMQAEEYGTPIAQTMRILSEQFRQDRLVEAEEKAAKLPTLLSLPMMLFIFPCIYIIIMGPAVINILPLFK